MSKKQQERACSSVAEIIEAVKRLSAEEWRQLVRHWPDDQPKTHPHILIGVDKLNAILKAYANAVNMLVRYKEQAHGLLEWGVEGTNIMSDLGGIAVEQTIKEHRRGQCSRTKKNNIDPQVERV